MPGWMLILLILVTSLVPHLTEGSVELLVNPRPDPDPQSYIRLLGKRKRSEGLRVSSRVSSSLYLGLLKTRLSLRGPWIRLNTSLLGVG